MIFRISILKMIIKRKTVLAVCLCCIVGTANMTTGTLLTVAPSEKTETRNSPPVIIELSNKAQTKKEKWPILRYLLKPKKKQIREKPKEFHWTVIT